MTLRRDKYTIASGRLDVGQGHRMYWQEWGKAAAPPIFLLHGGPGSGCSEKHKLRYDPSRHHVVFHDQRGSGLSRPFASIKDNTSDHLIRDIERLRRHLGIRTMYLSGGSWGSTLALFYAIKHPDRVIKLILWSLYLARPSDNDFVNEGYPRHSFPEAWERFIKPVPSVHRKNGRSIMSFYADKIRSKHAATAKRYANEWVLWEATVSSWEYDQRKTESEVFSGETNKAVATIETHYFMNDCFRDENYILDNIHRIRHIPCTVIHGRYDLCTPPAGAHEFAKAYGENSRLLWVNSGHFGPEMLAALRATLNASVTTDK